MKNIWITGAKGFVGLHLSKSLVKKKYNVYGIGNHKKSSFQNNDPLFKNFVRGNINDFSLQKTLRLFWMPRYSISFGWW